MVDTARGLARAAEQLAEATGPVAIDTERASGFRFGQRAFLVQIRREGAGTILIDPEAVGSLASVNEALSGVEWVLHAATQDMPCLRDLDMTPDILFDTELGGRLLGLRKVGLASMTEELLGFTLSKEHSAVDWSKRPLPRIGSITLLSTSRSWFSCAGPPRSGSSKPANSTGPGKNSRRCAPRPLPAAEGSVAPHSRNRKRPWPSQAHRRAQPVDRSREPGQAQGPLPQQATARLGHHCRRERHAAHGAAIARDPGFHGRSASREAPAG